MKKVEGLPTQITQEELRSLVSNAASVFYSGSLNIDSNYLSSASFLYEPSTVGLKSTQQLRIDWSQFQNHTFFNSAEVKVNVAFDKIINSFPFDGSKKEYEKFFESLTGFEKWTYDNWPKNVGYLNFVSGNGSYVTVADSAGKTLIDASRDKTAQNYLEILTNPITLEMQLFVPEQSNELCVVVQKQDQTTNQGFTLNLDSTSNSTYAYPRFSITSGSANLTVTGSILKGKFNHIGAIYDKGNTNKLYLYCNGKLLAESTGTREFGNILTNGNSLLVGSGSSYIVGGSTYLPTTTLSGSIDELRYWKSIRTPSELQSYSNKNVFTSNDLALYLKFNEPTGSLSGDDTASINRIVLDSSGKSLHGYINATGFTFDLRSTGSIDVPLTSERIDLNPVLFPAFTDVTNFNSELLLSASGYDAHNPNIITKLIPNHYLIEGQANEGFEDEQGNIKDSYSGNGAPGSGKIGSTQLMLSLLYAWAKFFDELKLSIDSFKDIFYVDYDKFDTSPDNFLPLVLKEYGFNVPNLFSDAAFDQYNDGENVNAGYASSNNSLKQVQNQLLRRILTNIGTIIRSKGTLHSIKSFFRTIGVNPDASIKIKEFGGPNQKTFDTIREKKFIVASTLDFVSGGLVTSPFLSGSRVEVGTPKAVGTFIKDSTTGFHGVSNNPNDGLFTSGSWTYESFYRWPNSTKPFVTQSLVRFETTGSTGKNLLLNLVLLSGSQSGTVRLYAKSDDDAGAQLTTLSVDGPFYNGSPWHFTVGKSRNDITGSVSSSYVLRAIQADYGNINYLYTTSSRYIERPVSSSWQNLYTTTNASGSYFLVGSSSVDTTSTLHLNSGSPSESRETNFNGQILGTRFWSKLLTEQETIEHALSLNCNGTLNPLNNFNFNTTTSGSWERLRIDSNLQQETKETDSTGFIKIFDYSQNNKHLSGTNFPVSKKVVLPILWNDAPVSSQVDEAVTSDKTRVRGFLNEDNLGNEVGSELGPIYSLNPAAEPTDDTRFAIEFSLVDALNRDIINIFATLDALDNAIGSPNNAFDENYADVDKLRELYFQRLTDSLNFKSFFEFFRWFDTSIGTFVDQLLPMKTKYLGTNFTVESHVLERHSKRYFNDDMYYAEGTKPNIEDRIVLQQITGVARKF